MVAIKKMIQQSADLLVAPYPVSWREFSSESRTSDKPMHYVYFVQYYFRRDVKARTYLKKS